MFTSCHDASFEPVLAQDGASYPHRWTVYANHGVNRPENFPQLTTRVWHKFGASLTILLY